MIAASQAATTETETILIVEDEVLIRMAVADYLRDCGYRVVEAADADEALEVLKGGHPIALVFSDVQFGGGMDGFALARWIKVNRPQTKVILTSGVTRTTDIAGELCEHGPIEKKPYHPKLLAERIRQTLARVRDGDTVAS
jgi:CheY-like chemotaxis protein